MPLFSRSSRVLPVSQALRQSVAVLGAIIGLTLALACGGGGGGGSDSGGTANPPTITGIQPASGPVGSKVTITGSNLALTSEVSFSPGIPTSFVAEYSQVVVMVPPGASTGPIQVTANGKKLPTPEFKITAQPDLTGPTIEAFAPSTAPAYAQVNITGTGFTGSGGDGTTTVAFGGVNSPKVVVESDTEIFAAVPPAAPNGVITVTTAFGSIDSKDTFTVDPAPPAAVSVSLLQPTTGPVGTVLKLTGSGFFSLSGVTMGGIKADFTADSDTSLRVTVPTGAATGALTLTSVTGGTASTTPFTVTTGTANKATILTVEPLTATPGSKLILKGTNFFTVNSATVGGVRVECYVLSDNLISIWLPNKGAKSGPVVLATSVGPVTYSQDFTLDLPKPSVSYFTPDAGPAGTTVTIYGINLGDATSVKFGTLNAKIVARGYSYIDALAPALTADSRITVTTPGGETTSNAFFKLQASNTTQDMRIQGMYLTQAVQDLGNSVPLVSGRDARARVFVTSNNYFNSLKPTVRVTIADTAGAVLMTKDIPSPGTSLPTKINEVDPDKSWEVTIPGNLIKTGNTFQAKILPAAGEANLDPNDDSYPAGGGAKAMNVVDVAPIGITLIPVNWGGHTGYVTDGNRTPESWIALVRKIYPFRDIDLKVAPVFTFNQPQNPDDIMTYVNLRNTLEAERLKTDPKNRRYWYAVCSLGEGVTGTVTGLGDINDVPASNLKRTAMGWDGTRILSTYKYNDTLAHELGHLLRRLHAPCGASFADPDYPYFNAYLGATGYDLATNKAIHPTVNTDIMSYCPPRWISDYHYKLVLRDRAWEVGMPMPLEATPQPGLLVWGTIQGGQATLQPAIEVPDISDQPMPGPYTLIFRDASGATLQEIPFTASVDPDLPQGADIRSFCFAVPYPAAIKDATASIVVTETQDVAQGATAPRKVLALTQAAPAALPRDPVAVPWGPGVVHLSWDASTHPLVMVADAATGQPIGTVTGGSADLVTDAKELLLDLSSGIRSIQVKVKVGP